MFKRLTDVVLRRNTREDILDPMAQTERYQVQPWAFALVNWQDRPRFNLFMVELMLTDPRVAFGIAISNGLEMCLQVEVTGPNPKVNDFVKEQWDRIWESSSHQLLRAQHYGFMAFEVMYKEVDGIVEFDRLKDLYPSDTRPLTLKGQLRGIKVDTTRRSLSEGATNDSLTVLNGMKGLWLTHDEQFNNRFGRSALVPAYPPWYEKTMKGGTLDLRKLRMTKDSWLGDVYRYPEHKTFKTPGGVEVSARELAMELQNLRASGGGFVLPSTRDQQGNLDWDYTPPTSVQGATPILECITAVDCEIFDGLLLPREVVEAAETGSGFSGRSIPFMAACTIRDTRGREVVKQTKAQVIDKLVALNWGLDAARRYEITALPLLKTVGKLMGDMGQPNTTSQAGGQPQPTPQPNQNNNPAQDQDDEDDDVQFATVDEPRVTRDKRTTRRAMRAGSTIAEEVRGRLDALLKKND